MRTRSRAVIRRCLGRSAVTSYWPLALLAGALVACSAEGDPGDPGRDAGARDGRSTDVFNDLAPALDGATDADGSALDALASDAPSDRAAPALDTSSDTAVADAVDAAPVVDACVPDAFACVTADRLRTCLPDGGSAEADCPAGQICVDVLGCAVCEPGAVRCGTDGLTLETCASDGASWAPGTRCDAAAGMVCDGYRCVNACARAASQRSYLGCEYWPTTMGNSELSGVFTFAVTVANPQTYPVVVTISGAGLSPTRTVTVPPGATTTQELPWVPALSQQGASPGAASALVRNGAYRLASTAPVAVYQFNPLQYVSGAVNSFTNDASLLLPTHVLTGQYMALTHNTWQQNGGEIVVVGTDAAPTRVTVDLRGSIRAGTGVAAGDRVFTLNRGDVVQLVGGGGISSNTCAPDDLSGSTITADHPVAVFVGHDCTFMPCTTGYCDHLEEQLFPNETWGRRYVVSALRERSATETSVIRILSQADGNVLRFDGFVPAGCGTLNARQFCEFETGSDFAVTGTQPMLIAQFMVGQDRVAGQGDPAMVLEVPTQQFRTSYTFNVPGSYARNFVTVVYPAGMLPRLDGVAIAAGTAVAGTAFVVSRFTLGAGSHRMAGPAPFGIKVSGTGDYTSYMYPGGLDLNQITGP